MPSADEMNHEVQEVQTARERILAGQWIARAAENFRHLPPPAGVVWLGVDNLADTRERSGDQIVRPDSGWLVDPMPTEGSPTASDHLDIRWFDTTDGHQRSELFRGLKPPRVDDSAPFSWAHHALGREAMRLRIRPAEGRPTVWLQVSYRPCAQVEAPLLVLDLAPGVDFVLVEVHERHGAPAPSGKRATYPRDIVQNLQMHLNVGRGSTLQHVRMTRPAARDQVAHHIDVALECDASYSQVLLATSCAYHLQRTVVSMPAAGSTAKLASVLLADQGAIDRQSFVDHVAPRTTSAVEVMALGRDESRIVASARTRIGYDATDAQVSQRLKGIPTGGMPKLVLRPHLEILHDQVQASHGATWGCLPEEALFYATQRGISLHDAQALVLRGLAQDLMERHLTLTDAMKRTGIDEWLRCAIARHLTPIETNRHE